MRKGLARQPAPSLLQWPSRTLRLKTNLFVFFRAVLDSRTAVAFGISTIVFLTSCRPSQRGFSSQNQTKTRIALVNLLTRTNQNAFVIIEEQSSRRFIQFSGSPLKGLQLDLPVQTLNPDQLTRAKQMFGELGVQLETWQLLDRPGGKPVRDQSGFQMQLGTDIDRAVSLVSRVFSEVYQFSSNCNLVIIEN